MTFASFILQMLPVATIVGQVLLCITLILWFWKPQGMWMRIVDQKAILIVWIVALVSTLGSLFYSEIMGYHPCTLCWYQRIFMYPQVILLGIALWKKDRGVAWYSLGLSVVGGLLALYHYLLQLGIVTGASCSVVGYSESCSKVFILQFGYITIPLMAVTAFAMMVSGMAVVVWKEMSRNKHL